MISHLKLQKFQQLKCQLKSISGKINFKAVNDSLYEQTVSHSRGFYITRRDQGHSLSRWRLPQIYYGGNLSVDAAKVITADSKTFSIPEFKESAMMLSSHTGTGWLKELITRDDVQWNGLLMPISAGTIKSSTLIRWHQLFWLLPSPLRHRAPAGCMGREYRIFRSHRNGCRCYFRSRAFRNDSTDNTGSGCTGRE